MTIWKFELQTTDEQVIKIPKINRPLTVQTQHGVPCLWAVVDPASPKIHVRIRVFETGDQGVTAGHKYIGTYQLHEGGLVFHVFVEGRA